MQAKIADMYTKMQASRAYLYHSAQMFDNGVKSNKDSAAVFLHNSKAGVEIALECI
jgi:isovaleryl-CoA dehydrogenase